MHSPHACIPFSCSLLLGACVLAMGTYHEQEVVPLFFAQYVPVALHVLCQVLEQWAVPTQHYVVAAVVLRCFVIT